MAVIYGEKQTDEKGEYVVVKSGNTLWGIAKKFLNNGNRYTDLAKWNNISNPSHITVGQKIYLSADGSSGSSDSAKKNDNKVEITHFGELSTANNTLLVMWTWHKEKDNTESYKIKWSYKTADGIWLSDGVASNSVDKDAPEASRHSTFNVPEGALAVKVKIMPIAKTETKNGKETSPWTADWSEEKTWTAGSEEDKLPKIDNFGNIPTIENDKITIYMGGISEDGKPKQVEFEVRRDDATKATYNSKVNITATRTVSYSLDVPAGHVYQVRARFVRDSDVGEWSEWSEILTSSPLAPKEITKIESRKASPTSQDVTCVYLEWSEGANATGYRIEWYTDSTNIGLTSPDDFEDVKIDPGNEKKPPVNRLIKGLVSGKEYFFRVKSVSSEGGESAWSPIKSVILGSTPEAPTIWSSTTTVIAGESVTLNWMHNSADGSKETRAELEIWVYNDPNDPAAKVKLVIPTIFKPDDPEGEETSSQYVLSTSTITEVEGGVTVEPSVLFREGAKVTWCVKTAGITGVLGTFSEPREITVYAQPRMDFYVSAVGILDALPLTVTSEPYRKYVKQSPISYNLTIIANESYDTVDNMGNDKTVKMGDTVYYKYIDAAVVNEEISAGEVSLENNINYTITCKMAMSSGLTATESRDFKVSWTSEQYVPTAEIGIDYDMFITQIRPYCEDITTTLYAVTKSNGVFDKDENTLLRGMTPIRTVNCRYDRSKGLSNDEVDVYGEGTLYSNVKGTPVYKGSVVSDINEETGELITETIYYWKKNMTPSALTTTGEQVLYGSDANGVRTYYCEVITKTLVENITLAVYRREFDGSFTLIADGLRNERGTTVIDPHPALDYARYRIVATSTTTGTVSYSDLPGYPVGGKSIIIQWDETWTSFDVHEEDPLEQPAWVGSFLSLPYNIDVQDGVTQEVAFVNYAGRTHPVSYYGTHIGQTATWKVAVPKNDEETIYALRRLSRWMGDAYVREPSGTGYWANVAVSFSQTHCDPVVPVSLNITRVEGGM